MTEEERKRKHCLYMIEWQKKNKDKVNAYHRRYRREHPEKGWSWDDNHLQEHRASALIRSRVYKRTMKKPKTCSVCGSDGNGIIVGHHNDYSKPADVEWLCQSCHMGKHKMASIQSWDSCPDNQTK